MYFDLFYYFILKCAALAFLCAMLSGVSFVHTFWRLVIYSLIIYRALVFSHIVPRDNDSVADPEDNKGKLLKESLMY